MSEIDNVISEIRDRDEVHRLIDAMPDGARAILIVDDTEKHELSIRTYGSMVLSDALGLLQLANHFCYNTWDHGDDD